MKLITLTSDFGVQSQGIGAMEAAALEITPHAQVVHLAHGLPDFDIISASWVMESVFRLPIGYHVCVVDPSVGTKQKRIIIKTKRGDYLIGPDNGVLISAASILGGCEKAVEIANPRYMKHPVSPIFHGRDIFTPAAAYLAKGVRIEDFGKELQFSDLTRAPYKEAELDNGSIRAQVIHNNKFGSVHLNILHSLWDNFSVEHGDMVKLRFNHGELLLPFVRTFGDVVVGAPLLMKDDFFRIELAVNQGNFSKQYKIKLKDVCMICKMAEKRIYLGKT